MRSWLTRWPKTATTASAVHARRSSSPDLTQRASALAGALTVVALEVLPITAWLDSGAASQAGDVRQVALPIWLLATVVLAAWGVARLRQRATGSGPGMRTGAGWASLWSAVVIGGWLLTLLVFLRAAPGAYGRVGPASPLALDWLGAIPGDVVAGSPRLLSVVGLALLGAYLWWRGLSWGAEGLLHDRVSRIFRLGLGAVVLAVVFAAAIAAPARVGLEGRLALVLPLEVASGLLGLALVHIVEFTRLQPQREGETPLSQPTWLLTALVLSGAVVGGAVALGGLFSFDLEAALPSGLVFILNALASAFVWILEAIAYVLYLVFGQGLGWLIDLLRQSKATVRPRIVPAPPGSKLANHTAGVPPDWLLAGRIIFVVVLVLVVCYVLVRILNRMNRMTRRAEFEETREALDARGLLGAQLRALFGRRGARTVEGEDLPRASIRQVYREVLRGALRAGRGRRAAETPLEYERRLLSSRGGGAPEGNGSGLPAGDLAALTRMYERARYGEQPEDAPEQAAASALGQRLAGWFARHRQHGT